jgi:exopolysaccharide biosynthesis polyprenyl glycosylphosphotransferase
LLRGKALLLQRLLRIGDHGIAAAIALAVTYGLQVEDGALPLLVFVIAGTLAYPSAMGVLGLYESQRRRSLAHIGGQLVLGAALTATVLVQVCLALARPQWSPYAASIALAQLVAFATIRLALYSALRIGRRHGRNVRHVVVIGTGPRAKAFATEVASNPAWGLRIVAFLDECSPMQGKLAASFVRKLTDFPDIVRQHPVDEVVVALPRSLLFQVEPIAAECALIGVPLSVLSDLFADKLPASQTVRYGRLPAIQFADVVYDSTDLFFKRCLDVALGSALLVLFAPLIGVAMLAIHLTSPGAVLYRQVRLGRNGRPFVLLKLRSMVADADAQRAALLELNEVSGPVFKIRNDPRVTPVGRFLRRWSIDETPQLWNVVRGDMSLVGPRPPLPHEVDMYDSWHRRRISVRPGITCLWQIHGRSQIPFAEWVDLDLHYIDHWSLGLDLRILLRTPLAVLRRHGAS